MLTRRHLLTAAATAFGALAGATACGPATDSTTPLVPDTTAASPAREAAPAAPAGAPALPGRLLFVGDANVVAWERGAIRRLTGDRVSRQPAWSPDGKRIAHVKIDVNSSEIWIMDADGSNSRQLTQNYSPTITRNNWAFRPVWWPDGSRLLYLSEETTNDLMVWQMGTDGKNRRPFLTVPDMEGGLDMPAITADARRLAVVSYRGPGSRSQVWTYTLPSGPWHQLTETAEGAYDPAWSPDGTRIAYAVRSKGRHDLWVMAADGSEPRQVTDTGACRAPCWSPDGQWLAFLSLEGAGFDLWAMPAPLAPSAAAAGAPIPGATGTPIFRSPEPRPASPRQLTKGAQIDAVSGLSWTR